MARRSQRYDLRTIAIPAEVYRRGQGAMWEQIACHVYQFVTAHKGDIWALALACYFQGLMDAAFQQEQQPGWPLAVTPEESA